MDRKSFLKGLNRANIIIYLIVIMIMIAQFYFIGWAVNKLRKDEISRSQIAEQVIVEQNARKEQRYMKDEDLKTWANNSIQKALSFKFDNYKKSLQEGSRVFVRHGWEDFTKYIQEREFISTIEKDQCAISTNSRKTEILEQGNNPDAGGRYEWELQIDLAIEFPGCVRTSELKKIYIVIATMPVLEGIGIGIVQWKEIN